MSDSNENYRRERIQWLLHELKYEIMRGLTENEIGEGLEFTFVHPRSREIEGGCVYGKFELFPARPHHMDGRRVSPNPHIKRVK